MTEIPLVAEVEEVHVPVTVRRFGVADLSSHGPWIMKRLIPLFPDMPERWIGSWLAGLINNNEHLFLYQPHAIALAQVVSTPGLRPGKMVQERFVWVEDKTDKEQLRYAADFYDHFHEWARSLSAERMIVRENSDVPKNLIEERIGRLFVTEIFHARV